MSNLKFGILTSGLIASAAIALIPVSAFAGADIFDDTVSTCTTTNCSSLTIPGSVVSFNITGFVMAGSFNINVIAAANECVRLEVTSATTDFETKVIAPNGQVFRNDDGGGGGIPTNPLVKIASAPNTGWYTVHISHFAGNAVNGNFTLLYGRYNAGNPNCAGATAPLSDSVQSPELAKPEPTLAPLKPGSLPLLP